MSTNPPMNGRRPTRVAHEAAQAFFRLMMRRVIWYQSVAAEFGLSPIQAKTLGLMDPTRPSTMGEVAETAGCGPSNLTGIIDKLEARGLVKRRAARGDRRAKVVAMTRAGAALRTRLATRLSEPAPWMLALPARDQRRLRDILQKGLAFEPSAAGSRRA